MFSLPKPNGTFCMCTDYCKVNYVAKIDTFPILRINDCIDKIGQAKYFTKIRSAKRILANTSDRQSKEDLSIYYTKLFQYKVMPFGMNISPSLINSLIFNLNGCKAYIDVVSFPFIAEERSCKISDSYKELGPDDCICYLTEQNIVINDHNDAMILYIGRCRSIQIYNKIRFF